MANKKVNHHTDRKKRKSRNNKNYKRKSSAFQNGVRIGVYNNFGQQLSMIEDADNTLSYMEEKDIQ